jgi:hypothetical protein
VTIKLSPEMEKAVRQRAEQLRVPVDEVVQQAVGWYMHIDPELLDEFKSIEQAHAEALWAVEDHLDAQN